KMHFKYKIKFVNFQFYFVVSSLTTVKEIVPPSEKTWKSWIFSRFCVPVKNEASKIPLTGLILWTDSKNGQQRPVFYYPLPLCPQLPTRIAWIRSYRNGAFPSGFPGGLLPGGRAARGFHVLNSWRSPPSWLRFSHPGTRQWPHRR